MVDGINIGPSIPSVNRQSSSTADSGKSASTGSASSSAKSSDAAVVVDVSVDAPKANPIENEVAEANVAAAGQEAPTTQELATALNADTVVVALGNNVDIRT